MTKDLLHVEYQRLAISWWKELFGTKLLMRRRKLDYEHFFFLEGIFKFWHYNVNCTIEILINSVKR